MKRYLYLTIFIIVFCLIFQSVALAGLSIPNGMMELGFGLIVAEYFALPWLIDQVLVKTGSNSNYWGTFWGSTAFSLLYLTNASITNFDFTAYCLSFLGSQVIGGVLGNKLLPFSGNQSPNTKLGSMESEFTK